MNVLKQPAGSERMQEISKAVREGAMAFLKLEYAAVGVFAVILAVLFAGAGVLTGDPFWYYTAGGFVAGAALSALAGFIGMSISVRANARVAEAAKKGLRPALGLAFRAGAVNGLAVVGLGLIGVAGLYAIFRAMNPSLGPEEIPIYLVGFGFGASLMSLFARIGGGIYTKAADVGADLVGKVEAGIPEDDPRNPAVIADNVGDNVGDCAGMGADLFETYSVTLVASMLLAGTASIFANYTFGDRFANGLGEVAIVFPLLLGTVAIVASILGVFMVRLPKSGNIMNALYMGVIGTVVLSAIGFYVVTVTLLGLPIELFFASLVGLAITLALVFITDYYTSTKFKPVQSVADASRTGSATNIIQGLAVGLESVFVPVLIICAGMIGAYLLGNTLGAGMGLYAVATAAVGMLSVTGMIVSLDTYGPVTDNAGGIAEMSDLPAEVREVTDALDAVGNTTKATTKGYAIGSAGLAALVLFADYVEHASGSGARISFDISNVYVLVGLLLGAAVVFLFSSYLMRAVGRAAYSVVVEVRTQFKEKPGIMKGTEKPDYARCVSIVTRSALKEMALPGSLAVITPLAVGFLLGAQTLGGFLIGIIVAGLVMAIMMSNGGGAWDNAKKLIEEGIHGGKGSDAHKAAVVGDTVGDPFKDTAGPAINPLIKAINTIAVIFASVFVAYGLIPVS